MALQGKTSYKIEMDEIQYVNLAKVCNYVDDLKDRLECKIHYNESKMSNSHDVEEKVELMNYYHEIQVDLMVIKELDKIVKDLLTKYEEEEDKQND